VTKGNRARGGVACQILSRSRNYVPNRRSCTDDRRLPGA
jgi:hypothetical protein